MKKHVIIGALSVLLLFVGYNFVLCPLIDGKAKMKELFIRDYGVNHDEIVFDSVEFRLDSGFIPQWRMVVSAVNTRKIIYNVVRWECKSDYRGINGGCTLAE